MLIDIHEKWGLEVIAQVDLDRRVHRNQDTKALGRMAFVIIRTFLRRIERLGRVEIKQDLFDKMIQYSLTRGKLQPEIRLIEQCERAPMATVTEYREKFAPSNPD
jgi:glucosyl-3-phosphoglycerate synthase